ncbi:MAG: transcriptional regulator [bacterium]|nr:transcriptional regulator [bacterium]
MVRARDLDQLGIARTILVRLVARGSLVRIGRGLYQLQDADVTEYHALVEVAARVPSGVVNLLSAAAFHELTDDQPHAVWLAVRTGTRRPRLEYPPLELTRTAPRFLDIGVATHTIEGIRVRITEPARTVVDCFKFRSRVGLDVAVAALRQYLREHRTGRPQLWEVAGFCRVQTVIRPYLEAMS